MSQHSKNMALFYANVTVCITTVRLTAIFCTSSNSGTPTPPPTPPPQTYHTIYKAWFHAGTKLQYKYMYRRAARVGIWKGVIAAVTEPPPPPPPPRYVIVFLNPVTKFYFLWATVRLQIQTILILPGKIPNVTHFSCWLYGRACSQKSLTKLRRPWGIPYPNTRLSKDSAWCM